MRPSRQQMSQFHQHSLDQMKTAGTAARVIGGVFGLIFFGVGLTVIGLLWGAPFGEFHSPPLFFRIFGSLVALGPLVVGGALATTAVLAGRKSADSAAGQSGEAAPPDYLAAAGYVCPRCGAPLGEQADVSPHGDTKCRYCNAWFNVHHD